jgi:hypothetical protein
MGGSRSRSITRLAAVGLVSVGFVGVAGVAGSGRVLKIEGTTATYYLWIPLLLTAACD